jgi:hypothetical protein
VPDGWVGELAGTPAGHAHVFAVMPWVAPRLAELLDRDLVTESAPTGARTALLRTLERVT